MLALLSSPVKCSRVGIWDTHHGLSQATPAWSQAMYAPITHCYWTLNSRVIHFTASGPIVCPPFIEQCHATNDHPVHLLVSTKTKSTHTCTSF
eukprot:scaffold2760_cov167-Amphora_coffeaeformis.AAC.2